MFIVDLAELHKRGDGLLEVQRNIDAHEFRDELDNISFIDKTKAVLVFRNDFGTISLKIKVEFDYDTVCDRCMTEVRKNMSFEASHIVAMQSGQEEQEEDKDVIVIENYKLDVDELVLNDIILNLPMKQLCAEDCKGLCSECGTNLNEGECSCNAKKVDPRWDKLLEYLKEEK